MEARKTFYVNTLRACFHPFQSQRQTRKRGFNVSATLRCLFNTARFSKFQLFFWTPIFFSYLFLFLFWFCFCFFFVFCIFFFYFKKYVILCVDSQFCLLEVLHELFPDLALLFRRGIFSSFTIT